MKNLLETKRLLVKPPDIEQVELIYSLDSDPDVMRYIGNGSPRSRAESLLWYQKSISHFKKHGFSFGLVFEKVTGEFVGRAGISYNAYDDTQPDIEIGYRLYKKFWNKGYATELAEALVQWGFQNLKIEKLCGFVQPDNRASCQVLEKIGMQYIGFDKYADEKVVRYELLKNEGKSYDLIANDFSNMRDDFYAEKKYLDIFISHLATDAKVLDVGCGSGHPIASYLIENGLQVTGLDSSKELLNIASKKCPKMKRIYGDIRTVAIEEKYDGIMEWWCLFHIPKPDHGKMITRFAQWLKIGGILEFTTGDHEYEAKSSDMLDQELAFYSLDPLLYEKYLKENGFKILLRESDQETHLVWIAKRE